MTYTYTSQTSSGWIISTDPDAPADQRWRAVHPEFGTRFFDRREQILEYTVRHMVEMFERRFGKVRRNDDKRT